MNEKIIIEGNIQYENDGNGYFYEWISINEKSMVEILDDLFKKENWRYRSKKVRVTIEKL